MESKVGKQQVAMYQQDGNTTYSLRVGKVPSGVPHATGETVAQGKESLVGPNKAIENTYVQVTVDLGTIQEDCGNSSDTMSQLVKYTLGHEGFHAHDLASGLITVPGYFKRKANLDPLEGQNIVDPRGVAWFEHVFYRD
jgi:hypothetical protein